jgi:hypothetical protein
VPLGQVRDAHVEIEFGQHGEHGEQGERREHGAGEG